MPTSTSNIFCRVNRRRPCRICGKPDWCVFVRNETLSVCMRVSDGARKINLQGGAIFIHDDWCESRPIGVRLAADLPQSPIAPAEIRDFVYGKLIELSPATLYPGALITGEKGLLARGLSERHFSDYGGLPAGSRDRDRIARLLRQEMNDHFSINGSLRGVPGFWEDSRCVHLWKPKDYLLPRLLIPVRDGSGPIQACQMRLPFTARKGLRYLWLSSSDLPHGTGSGSPIHFKFRLADLPREARIVIVEGALKADIISTIRPELYIVATPCVTANHDALVELTRGRSVLMAFDQDVYSNETVCFHLAALIARRLWCERTLATTRIASWDARVKGIDDAAVRNLPITSISVQQWLDRLSPRFRRLAMTRLSEIVALPRGAKTEAARNGVGGDGSIRLCAICQLVSGEGPNPSSLHLETGMPIRVHISQLSDEALLAKLGVKRRAKPRELERPHQVALIKWVRSVKGIHPALRLLYAVPNGGDRNLRVARKLRAEGVLAGVADLCLPAARRGYHGLYLEMKSEEGVATKEQKEFLRGISEEGYCAVVAHGVDEARATLEWYIGSTDYEPPSVLRTRLICLARNSGSQRERRREKK